MKDSLEQLCFYNNFACFNLKLFVCMYRSSLATLQPSSWVLKSRTWCGSSDTTSPHRKRCAAGVFPVTTKCTLLCVTSNYSSPSDCCCYVCIHVQWFLLLWLQALTKFLKCVNWDLPQEAKQALELLGKWKPMDVEDSLELLSSHFTNPTVRRYAVARLQQADDEVGGQVVCGWKNLLKTWIQICVFPFYSFFQLLEVWLLFVHVLYETFQHDQLHFLCNGRAMQPEV